MPSDTQPPTVHQSGGSTPCLSAASFWVPNHVVGSAWLEHGPFAFWLIDAIRPRNFVELGSHNGFSYFCVCQAVRQLGLGSACYAVDSWQGDEHAGFYGEEVFAAVSSVHERHYSDISTLMRGYFSEALPYFSDGTVDLLHIDGRHGYEDVLEDFNTWRSKLSLRGVVLFHDTNVRERDFGVWRLWAELRDQYPSFEFLHGHGLGVLAFGPEVPDGLKPLVFASEAERAAIQRSYARLGRAIYLQRESEQAAAEVGRLRQEVADGGRYARSLEEDIALKQSRIATLNTEVVDGGRYARSLEEDIALKQRRIATLDTEVATAAHERDTLHAALDAKSEEIARQESAVAHITAVAEVIADHVVALQAELRLADQKIVEFAGPAALAPGLLAERERLLGELGAIRNSTFWRRTDPVRLALARHPRLRRVLLGSAKLAWWSVTLRLPQRLKVRRQRQREAVAALPAPENAKQQFTKAAHAELAAFLASDMPLTLSAVEAPDVSIVIVLWNQAHLTLRCLRAIAAASGPSREVILVDNGSTDETATLLKRVEGARIIRSPENLGFLRGCNRGAEVARGRAILLLNSDAFLRQETLAAAMETLESAPDIGAVGARLLLPSGRLQEAGSIVWADGSCLGYLRGEVPEAFEAMFRRDVDYCSGACLLIRRDLWQRLGGFDEAFAPAYYEETDFCLRLQAAGYRVVYDPAVAIDHFEFGSEAKGGDSTAAMQRNQAVFRERHAAQLRHKHLPPDVHSILTARQAAARPQPRLLVIDNEVPLGAGGAGYPRARELLAAAVGVGWAVTLFPLHAVDIDWEAAWREIPRDVEIVSGHGVPRFVSFMRARHGYYDTILISRPENMTLLRGYFTSAPDLFSSSRIIYDSEALAANRSIARARFEGKPYSEAEAEALITEELALARNVDAILCVNQAEAKSFARHGVPVHVLSHSIACHMAPPSWTVRTGFLFIGRLKEQDAPNWVGLAWFIREVWPLIRSVLPKASLSIIGQLHPEHDALEAPGVRLLGPLDDLGPAYDAARVFIAPVHFAAGVPLKIIEAGAAGVPVVGTPLMAEQLLWQPGAEIGVATTADEFARTCVALHEDEVAWNTMQQAAQARVRAEYGPETFVKQVQDILNVSPYHPLHEMKITKALEDSMPLFLSR